MHPAKAGRVVAVSEDALWGNVVEIMDADGVIWRYCGLRAATVKIGDDVTTADTLGTWQHPRRGQRGKPSAP